MFPITVTGEAAPTERAVAVTGPAGGGEWHAPEETPVAFVYNRRNYAVMMATPDDLADFAAGFSLSEQVIASPSEILALDIHHTERGIDLRIRLNPDRLARLDTVQRRRSMIGAASCGLCGLESADELFEPLPVVAGEKVKLDEGAVARALTNLRDHQPLNKATHTVHAAAWAGMDGNITLAREDVGRHNALDKLLGAIALSETTPLLGFVVMSSRCSYELIEKAARNGVAAMAFMSGPTSFALRKAREANMAVYARSPDGVMEVLG